MSSRKPPWPGWETRAREWRAVSSSCLYYFNGEFLPYSPDRGRSGDRSGRLERKGEERGHAHQDERQEIIPREFLL